MDKMVFKKTSTLNIYIFHKNEKIKFMRINVDIKHFILIYIFNVDF